MPITKPPDLLFGISVAVGEDYRLRVFQKEVLRRIFGSKRAEATGDSIKFEKLHYNLHSSPNIIRGIKLRRVKWTEHAERMRAMKKCIQNFGRYT
jgi:hypothetical protein